MQLLISESITEELRRVLLYPKLQKYHRRTAEDIDHFIQILSRIAVNTSGELIIKAVKNDPTDDKYIVCAVEGRADYIRPLSKVTVDIKHRKLYKNTLLAKFEFKLFILLYKN